MIVASCIHLLLSLVSEKPELSQDLIIHALKFNLEKYHFRVLYITQTLV